MSKTIFEAANESDPFSAPAPGVLRVAGWGHLSWLRHGFSTRAGGVSTIYRQPQASLDLNLGWTADDSLENVAENRSRFIKVVYGSGLAIPPEDLEIRSEVLPSLVTVRQVHSGLSLVVPDRVAAQAFVAGSGRAVFEGDGLITCAPGVLLGVQTADCVPVLIVDPVLHVIAGFHAGWRGTVARIVEHGIAQMAREFGSRPEGLLAAVGPSIGPCCYTVGEQVLTEFHTHFDYADTLFTPEVLVNPAPHLTGEPAANAAGQPASEADQSLQRLDLWQANRRQLLAAGIPADNITVVGECTACAGLPGPRRYFSHRAEHGFTGRMLNIIGIAGA